MREAQWANITHYASRITDYEAGHALNTLDKLADKYYSI